MSTFNKFYLNYYLFNLILFISLLAVPLSLSSVYDRWRRRARARERSRIERHANEYEVGEMNESSDGSWQTRFQFRFFWHPYVERSKCVIEICMRL